MRQMSDISKLLYKRFLQSWWCLLYTVMNSVIKIYNELLSFEILEVLFGIKHVFMWLQ